MIDQKPISPLSLYITNFLFVVGFLIGSASLCLIGGAVARVVFEIGKLGWTFFGYA